MRANSSTGPHMVRPTGMTGRPLWSPCLIGLVANVMGRAGPRLFETLMGRAGPGREFFKT